MSVINRQLVLEILCEECAYRCKTEEVKLKCCFNYQAIATLPPADVKPVVRGEWINAGDFEQCSVCKGTHLKKVSTVYGDAIWIKSDFCPNCGADMRERSEKE